MRLKDKPQVVSILRKRTSDSSHDAFASTWLPQSSGHHHIPTYVINAEKLGDPNETISIGLICSSLEELSKEPSTTGSAELFQIRDIDELFDKNFEDFFVRPFMKIDIPTIIENFTKANWPKSEKTFQKYWQEQENGIREVWLGFYKGEFAGYVTLTWESLYQPFKDLNIPEIMDLNILPEYREKGLGSHLLEIAEEAASKKSEIVGIGCGLHESYGNAQKLYSAHGYVPDGRGLSYKYELVEFGSKVKLDDDLILWLTKKLV